MWAVVVLTKAVPFSLFSLLWRVVFNTFVFVCTENILNSNHKTALNESPGLPLPVTVVSKSDTISTPLEGGCPFFFSEIHLSGSSVQGDQHLFFLHPNHLRASAETHSAIEPCRAPVFQPSTFALRMGRTVLGNDRVAARTGNNR